MSDSIASGEHLGLAKPSGAFGLRLTVAPRVDGEAAAHSRDHRPAIGVRVLRILGADRPEQHTCVKLGWLRRHGI